MKPRVFISQWMPQKGIDLIKEYCEIDYHAEAGPLPKEQFIERAKKADALVMFVTDKIDGEIINKCPNLRIIASFGKGYDNIDVGACTAKNILVIINKDSLTNSPADLAIGLILSLCRNILPGDRHVRNGDFKGWHPTNLLGKDFHHSKLGIIGLGLIGTAIARRAKGFDVDLSYYDVERKAEQEKTLGIKYYDNICDLISQNDFLVVACDLRPENYRLINAKTLEYLKPGSYLINISRGSVVDERAVAEALKSGKLSGYAADVFEFEDKPGDIKIPYIQQNLLTDSDHTVFTPHIGTGTKEAREQLAISTAQQLLLALQGQRPAGALNNVPGLKNFFA
ncbi:MAG: hydroxyacid dehydrogenase [Clostridia bacterium]|nr:hydroxyacid dehydrogenase [Clostridia bacterium]